MVETNSKRALLPEPTWIMAGLLFAWGLLMSQARHHWGGESYYNFGWFVPPLAIWLMLRNLSRTDRSTSCNETVLLLASILTFLPFIMFHALSEVNPFWRVPLWGQALCLSFFTLLMLYRLYGWQGIKAGAFPLLFLVTMIPWPYRMEQQIIQFMTEIVVGLAMHGLHFLSYPVEIAGNTMRLGDINIGVDEACSGIRSLQALFMVTLFLGSLFGQTPVRRLLAICVLPLIVILVNTARAIFLSTQVIVNGQEAYEYWHDPAGYIAFAVSMILIYATIELLNIGGPSEQSQVIDLEKIKHSWMGVPASKLSIGFLVIPVLVSIFVEGWFRYHEARSPARSSWELTLPSPDDPSYEFAEISDRIESALGYSYGHQFRHDLPGNADIEVYYYGYDPGNTLSNVSSYGHSPTICMSASGAQLVEEFPQLLLAIDELRIPFKHYLFDLPSTGEKIHVFWTVWEHRNMEIDPEDLQSLNARTQWLQLTKGRRDFSRQVLLAAVSGTAKEETARKQIETLFRDLIYLPED